MNNTFREAVEIAFQPFIGTDQIFRLTSTMWYNAKVGISLHYKSPTDLQVGVPLFQVVGTVDAKKTNFQR